MIETERMVMEMDFQPPRPLPFSMNDLENEINSINLYRQVDDKRWDAIAKSLNSDFPVHDCKPEVVCDVIKKNMDSAISDFPKMMLGKWKLVELAGMTAIAIAMGYIISVSVFEVLKLFGG